MRGCVRWGSGWAAGWVAGWACLLACVVALAAWGGGAFGQMVPYQGRLEQGGAAFDGSIDVRARLFSQASGGTAVTGFADVSGVAVDGGLFAVVFDFADGSFDGEAERWLEVDVRESGGVYETLSPRQRVLPVAEAVVARRALFAEEGPFEPLDTTRGSSSGMPPGSAFRVEVTASGQTDVQVELVGDVALEFEPISMGGALLTTPIRLRRALDVQSPSTWYDSFDRARMVSVEFRASSAWGETVWQIPQGFFVSYGYERGRDGGVLEVVEFAYQGSVLSRGFSLTGNGAPPRVPVLAEMPELPRSSLPGTLRYVWDGVVPEFSLAAGLPSATRPLNIFTGLPTGLVTYEPVSILSGVLVPGVLWDDFSQRRSRDLALLLENPSLGGSLPLEIPDGATGVLFGWRLYLADDGLPVEEFRGNWQQLP